MELTTVRIDKPDELNVILRTTFDWVFSLGLMGALLLLAIAVVWWSRAA
ncbi:MAG: hypothetical protein AABM30_07750 [Actinomycetota bacterium]